MTGQICRDLAETEQKLKSAIDSLKSRYKNDSMFLVKLEESQNAWEKFRDSQIELKFPEQDKQYAYGSLYPMCYCLEKISLTNRRIENLRIWIDGITEGDVCPGSVLIEDKP